MSETHPKLPEPRDNHPSEKKRPRKYNWERIGAIAGVVGAIAALAALIPALPAFHQNPSKQSPATHKMFDGPIAEIAIDQKGWDMRGFEPSDLTSQANQVTYRYAGHYKDKAGKDLNPTNAMCSIKLHANPSSSYPYGGDSGFVYLLSGTAKEKQGSILYNPTVDAIYRALLDRGEYVAPQCWPGNGHDNNDLRYPHNFGEYLYR